MRYHGIIREPATSAQAHVAATDDTLASESRSAFELLTRAVARLEPLGGAGEIEPARARLGTLLAREHALVELAGAQRSLAVDALLGAHVLAPTVAASVTIRVRAATLFGYEVRWPDGRVERPPPDEHDEQAAALTTFEREVLAPAAEAARVAGERLQQRARAVVHARAEAARAEAARVEAERAEAARVEAARVEAERAEAARAREAAARRSWLRRLFARLVGWLRALVGRTPPSLPASAAPQPLPAPHPPTPLPANDDALGSLEAALAGAKARLAALSAERDERRRALEAYYAERDRRARERLVELTTSAAPRWIELDLGSPEVPAGVVLVLRPSAPRDREPLDATLFADQPGAAAPLAEDRPTFRVATPPARAALVRQLEHLVAERPVALARRIVAALCLCRNRILDLDKRAHAAHDERSRELAGRRLDEVDTVRRADAGAQLPIARQGEKIVQAAAARLETLLHEVRAAWQQRIESCAGIEQLRAEVAAIEDGASHRLALVCDELRESMTIQFVRLVLELSRPLRDELMRKRIEVARGRSPTLEQSFDDVRVVLPASLDKTFGALATPDIGELLSSERGLFDPIFRTLAREKRGCVTRLHARLDDIERTTTRDLYAAAVFVSPLLVTTFKGLVSELVAAHQRWIDALVAEEELAWQKLQVRHAPALELVAPLEAAETGLAARLEHA